MIHEYERQAVPPSALRLHLNENTAGCSPRVLAAVREITRAQAAYYPDYEEVTRACALRFGVDPGAVLLTNGLDEGIQAVCFGSLRPKSASEPPQAIIAVPAFDMYAIYTDVAGGRIVEVPLGMDFEFPAEAVVRALTPATRVIFVTTPNNPSGGSVPAAHIFDIAAAAPEATIFVDEAYADFAGESLLGRAELARYPNIIVGRTFSKAYGLAGLRIGALIAEPERLAPLRRIVPPYSINVCATMALAAALEDDAYYEWYIGQALTSKAELYAAFRRMNIRFWPSDANFVLADFGSDAGRITRALAERGIYVRDKSEDARCRNCIRITAGVVDHTRACIAALEEVMCGERP